ncbi:hypothetical protein E3N88_20067 [Mikania micrantha]|uniref:Uncharacterized protein n=1 Tax=Mikania micrantha TaxID=192012 RepID=A0A5N6NGF1_9ASTR|nr:hypothetical protein E3N88_20067 [Mikania micrantha]
MTRREQLCLGGGGRRSKLQSGRRRATERLGDCRRATGDGATLDPMDETSGAAQRLVVVHWCGWTLKAAEGGGRLLQEMVEGGGESNIGGGEGRGAILLSDEEMANSSEWPKRRDDRARIGRSIPGRV